MVILFGHVLRNITIHRSEVELTVIVDDGGELKTQHKLPAGDWDGVRIALLRAGCVERQIVKALDTMETHNTATIAVTAGR
jgi:hypothetical protein